jgi:hypothetical protein
MKRYLLALMWSLPLALVAQNKFPQVAPEKNLPQPYLPQLLTDNPVQINQPRYGAFAYKSSNNNTFGVDFIEAGLTYYDLQSNGSAGRRLYLHADGNVSLTWTTTPDGLSGFPQRGSGYNYGKGSSFLAPTGDRIETTRMGWPSIGVLANGNEFVVAHDATNGGFRIATNTGQGSTNWTTGNPILRHPDGQRPIWNRTASNGNSLHLICNYSDSSSPGDPRVLSQNGVLAPMTYSRSLDGGLTWDKALTLLPEYDSTRILAGGGDNYAIDVKGNVVAIVAGGLGDDVALWKSTDNGDTFIKILADSFPYAPFGSKILALDTPFTNDGTVDVMIDLNNNVHVFWGLSRVLEDDTTTDGFSFFPATNGIVHWDEVRRTPQVIGGVVDENNNQTLDIEPGTFAGLLNGNIPSNVAGVARTGNTSITTMPCAGIDAQGRIFVTYSAPRELDLNIDLLNFRDVYIVASTDGGLTWNNPQNITQAQGKEDAFPTIARKVDDFVHVLWQQDDIPGTNLQNNSTGGNNHPVVINNMLYAAIPVSKILDNSIGQGFGVGVSEINNNPELFRVTQNYPNPFSNETNVLVYLSEMSDLQLEIRNIMGQATRSYNLGLFNPGNHEITIDGSGLSAGIYTYTISSGNSKISNKMMIK